MEINVTAKQLTQKEIQEIFLGHISTMVDYWAEESRTPDTLEKLEGLAFSFLTMLDGSCMDIPAFLVVPAPHPTDKEYCQEMEQDWWPQPPEGLEEKAVDVHGPNMLHELWHEFRRRYKK
jgi:hypothetical protein